MTLSNRFRIYRGIQHDLLLLTTKNYGCGSLGIVGGFAEGGEGEDDCAPETLSAIEAIEFVCAID